MFSMGRKYFHEKFFPRKFKVINFPQPFLVIYPCFFPNLLRQAWKLLFLSCAPNDGFWSQNKRRNDEFQIVHILKWENIQKRICCVERDCLRNSGSGNYFISVWFRIPVRQIQDSGLALGSKCFGVSTQKHPKIELFDKFGVWELFLCLWDICEWLWNCWTVLHKFKFYLLDGELAWEKIADHIIPPLISAVALILKLLNVEKNKGIDAMG